MAETDQTKAPPVIVMVDDDDEDIYLTKRAFLRHKSDLRFNSVPDGKSLFDYLDRLGDYKDPQVALIPSVILLDINIPSENGFDILSRLKKHENFSHLPVVMLTTSNTDRDIREAYRHGASSYICKSVNAHQMKKIAEMFCEYWFGFSEIPESHDKFFD